VKKNLLIIFFIIVVLFSGCSSKSNPEQNTAISPNTAQESIKTVSLYFLNDKSNGLNMETRDIPQNSDVLKQVFKELVNGPKDEFSKPIIPDGTKLISAQLKDSTAYINFSKDYVTNMPENTAKFRICALVNTLTGLSDINRVQILIEGNKVNSIKGYTIGLGPLKRTVITGEVYNNKSRVKKLQDNTKLGKETWRLDPLKVVQMEGGIVGFDSNDQFTLQSKENGKAVINAMHNNKAYVITLIQPEGVGENNIWVISDVNAQLIKISETDPSKGETFIYGVVKGINPDTRVLTIEREYQDAPDMNNKVGPDVKVLPDAVIHFQEKIGYNSQGGYKYSEKDISFDDIKIGDELGMILTKNKEARAIIVSDRRKLPLNSK
jgi:hypothetical protein